MRIVLLYPPPWKIPEPGEPPDCTGEGPPAGIDPAAVLRGDFLHIPSGLLSLAAQAMRAGHSVEVLNLCTATWRGIRNCIERRPADVFALSCFTSNRRGTASLARLIRELHPRAHIAVGGPHATALPREMLEHCSAIDTVIIGEGEEVFAHLLRKLAPAEAPAGIAGTAGRCTSGIKINEPAARIDDLDSLAPACDFAPDHIIMTSRGCPWDCSFCASAGTWGKKVRSHSPEYVFTLLDSLVNRCGLKALAIKDETFTLNRDRVLAICRGILERGLNFLWSCDTRADCLDRELLVGMRRAGCMRISLGVESAAEAVRARICKKIEPVKIRCAIEHARKLGFQVRLYMIVGSPGETRATLEESIAFVRDCGATEVIWNPYTIFPGTRDFQDAVIRGELTSERFFTEDFFELIPLLGRTDADALFFQHWLREHQGLQPVSGYSAAERREILAGMPQLHAAHLDLAQACYSEGEYDEALAAIAAAEQLGYPLPGLCRNLRACTAARRGKIQAALAELLAAKAAGLYGVVERNIQTAQRWVRAGGPGGGQPFVLDPGCSFEITRAVLQPLLPGPCPVPEWP